MQFEIVIHFLIISVIQINQYNPIIQFNFYYLVLLYLFDTIN